MFQSRLMAEPEGKNCLLSVSKNIRPNVTEFAQLKLGLSLCTDDKPMCQTLTVFGFTKNSTAYHFQMRGFPSIVLFNVNKDDLRKIPSTQFHY